MQQKETKQNEVLTSKKNKYKFSVREIIFLSVSTLSALIFSAVMPIALYMNFYGAIQLVVVFQIAFFFQIGLYKVNKPFSFTIMAILLGMFLIYSLPVGLSFVISALFLEIATLPLQLKGFERLANILKTSLFIPVTMLPYYFLFKTLNPDKFANSKYFNGELNNTWWFIILMTFIILLVGFLATLLAQKVAIELNKAGVFNKIFNEKKK